jgi:hypothetical protein
VVFLDATDTKMIYVGATDRVLKFAECGLSADKYFAFYDQVHTTGMDIRHVPDAKAALTLGKDMTFRDYAQGAYRMRGLESGQSIVLWIIPEVAQLIKDEVNRGRAGEMFHQNSLDFTLIFTRELCQIAALPPGEEQRSAVVPLGVRHPEKVAKTNRF